MDRDEIRAKLDAALEQSIKDIANEGVELQWLTDIVYSWMYDRCYDIGQKSGGLVEEIVTGNRK